MRFNLFRSSVCWLGAAVVALALFHGAPLAAQNSCSSCDQSNTSCNATCNPAQLTPQQVQQCSDSCYTGYTKCYNDCNTAWFTYHDWELLGGWSQREKKFCYQNCHRVGFRNCYAGRYYQVANGSGGAALYESCMLTWNSVEACCGQLETLCVDDNACWSL